jgi:Protein of unknown function (DUF3551)
MRTIMVMTFLAAAAATLAGPNAQAQSGANRAYCLQRGSTQECTFDSMAQCEATRVGETSGFCQPNYTRYGYPQ